MGQPLAIHRFPFKYIVSRLRYSIFGAHTFSEIKKNITCNFTPHYIQKCTIHEKCFCFFFTQFLYINYKIYVSQFI